MKLEELDPKLQKYLSLAEDQGKTFTAVGLGCVVPIKNNHDCVYF